MKQLSFVLPLNNKEYALDHTASTDRFSTEAYDEFIAKGR
jgi:hypothetical protein